MKIQSPYFIKNVMERLNITKTNKKGPLLPSLHHFNELTGKTKQKRADRRANIIKVLSVVIPQIDLDTFAWGQWFTNHKGETDFYTRGIDYLCQETGMNYKTICRAIWDMEDKGYLIVKKGEAIGKVGNDIRHFSIRKFTNKLFIELGFQNKTIETTKAWKRKKNEIDFYSKKKTKSCIQTMQRIGTVFKKYALPKPIVNVFKNVVKPMVTQKFVDKNKQSQLLNKAYEMALQSGRSPSEIYRQLIAAS